jgi:phage recombination protein Bet
VEPLKLFESLKATVFKNATNEELLALVIVANEYGLNPFLKEIYAFPAKGGGICPVVSVDGWNKMLVRQPDFDGIAFTDNLDAAGNLVSCTATIYVKGRSHPCEITEYLDECRRNTDPWNNMPHRMLRNRTLCQASRVAFGFSGVRHEQETDGAVAIEALVMPSEPPPRTMLPPAQEAARTAQPSADGEPLTEQTKFQALVVSEGYTFNHVQKWGKETGNIPDADTLPDFDSIPKEVCVRLLRAKAGLLKGLAQVKAQEAAQ